MLETLDQIIFSKDMNYWREGKILKINRHFYSINIFLQAKL